MNYILNIFLVEFFVVVDVFSYIEQIYGFCGLFGGYVDVYGDCEQFVFGYQIVFVGVFQLELFFGFVEVVCRRQNFGYVIWNKVDDFVICLL